MVLVAIGSVIAAVFALGTIAFIVRQAGGGSFITIVLQEILLAAGAYYVYTLEAIGLLAAVLIVLLPILFRLLSVILNYRAGKKVLDGEYGEAAMWAGELVQDEDEEFVQAMVTMSSTELREIGIIAESKEELRDITVEERHDQNS
jgi:hypothetical protein